MLKDSSNYIYNHHRVLAGLYLRVFRTGCRETDGDTLNMLREYIERGGPIKRNGHHLLFGLTREYSWLLVKTCASRAGLDPLVNPNTGGVRGISPHRLRDAFATHAIKLDSSADGLRLLQEHLGHQSIATTMKYRKVSGDEHRDWYQRLWSTNSA
jgi:integrase/recombinase XerD